MSRTEMTLGLPSDLILEDEILEGRINLKAKAEDWQKELAKAAKSILLWWDLAEDLEIVLGCGFSTGELKRGMAEVRPFRNPRTKIKPHQIIGALDYGSDMHSLAWLDGEDIDFAVGMVKGDRAWVIRSEPNPFIVAFSPHRWSAQNDIERRKGPRGTLAPPAASAESH